MKILDRQYDVILHDLDGIRMFNDAIKRRQPKLAIPDELIKERMKRCEKILGILAKTPKKKGKNRRKSR
uniref:Uncharacterized protein n=1 Tax=viral metagenome TaxID=1070528 RepID=A0A6M3LRV0_9ZZZZ